MSSTTLEVARWFPFIPVSRDDQRDAGRFLEERHLLPEAMLAKLIAMIAHEDDDGIGGSSPSRSIASTTLPTCASMNDVEA